MMRDGETRDDENFLNRERPNREHPNRENFDEDVREYTFFVDAEAFGLSGYEAAALAADEQDLHEAGVVSVDIPTGFGADLGDRIPVRVRATVRGLRFYAKLLAIRDPNQLDDLERICSAPKR